MEENKETVEEKITVEDMDDLLLDFEKAICEFCDFWKGQDFCYHNITKRYVKVFKSVYHKISSENDALASLVSVIDIAEKILFTIYEAYGGKWMFLLKCVRDKAEYAFAYDNQNYPWYLTSFLGKFWTSKIHILRYFKTFWMVFSWLN